MSETTQATFRPTVVVIPNAPNSYKFTNILAIAFASTLLAVKIATEIVSLVLMAFKCREIEMTVVYNAKIGTREQFFKCLRAQEHSGRPASCPWTVSVINLGTPKTSRQSESLSRAQESSQKVTHVAK